MRMFRAISAICALSIAGLSGGCKAPDAASGLGATSPSMRAAAPLKKQFRCLPEPAAFVAAHRGVSKGRGLAENSGSSLKALIDRDILFAEVDVAGLKDGTHILYHDGVWDEKSTGTGAVAASRWSEAQTLLLRDTEGELTADRPVTLTDALAIAKDKLYLEIDFKSSAKYEVVINAIRDAGMADRVILIAYNEGQAKRLAALAPDMAQSVTIKNASDIGTLKAAGVSITNMNAWLGRGPYTQSLLDVLDISDIPVLAWPNAEDIEMAAMPASLIVSDYAFKLDPIIGLTDVGRAAYTACLDQD